MVCFDANNPSNHIILIQVIIMDDEVFDEFEEATYNHPTVPNNQPSPPPPEPVATFSAFESHESSPANNLMEAGLTFQPAPNAQTSLQKQQGGGGESIWQSLGKSGSSHVISDPPMTIDFTKSYSLNEQITTPITQDFYKLDILQAPSVQNTLLLPAYSANIPQNQPITATPIISNDFLMEFSQPETTLQSFSSNSNKIVQQTSEAKVELTDLVTNTSGIAGSTNLYASLDFTSAAGFDLLAPMTENKPSLEVQKIVDIANPLTVAENLPNNDQLMQFDVFEQPAQTLLANPTSQPLYNFQTSQQPTTNVGNLMETATTSATESSLFDFGFTQPPKQPHVEKVEAEDGARKQSEEFQFHQAKPAEVEVRKQSQEFVFQTHQEQPPTQQLSSQPEITEDVQETYTSQQPPQNIEQPQITQNTQSYDAPQQEEADQSNPIEQQQPPAAEDDDDEFGDFEQTTEVQNSQPEAQPQSMPVSNQQDNTVTINEEYINSQESDFYRNRQKQLQQFVDSLPDYSFLFAKAFVS